MKNNLFLFICVISFMVTCSNATAQIKMHDDGQLSFQSLTKEDGIQFDITGKTSFEPVITLSYSKIVQSKAYSHFTKYWIVSYSNTFPALAPKDRFYVTGYGNVYYNESYTIYEHDNNKGNYPIEKPIELLSSLNGFFYDNDEYAGVEPDFIDNPNVNPDAIEGLMKDFEIDKSLGLDPESLELVLPEAVRHDPDGRLCVNYSAIIPVIVEALKEQQREIETLKELLRKNSLSNQQ